MMRVLEIGMTDSPYRIGLIALRRKEKGNSADRSFPPFSLLLSLVR